jgi:hypothetical protein
MGDLLHNITYPPAIKLGTVSVSKIMLGTEQVYPRPSCNQTISYNGATVFPLIQPIYLFNDLGQVTLTFDARSVPDRFIVLYNDIIKIDTGYRGDANYSYGQSSRSIFNGYLTGKVDGITGQTYPFTHANNSPDGYPIVTSPGSGTASFQKTTASPEVAYVHVYAPQNQTLWQFILSCPK